MSSQIFVQVLWYLLSEIMGHRYRNWNGRDERQRCLERNCGSI